MISLDANEALVVYKQDPQTQGVERYIKYGPTLFMPMANEWLVLIIHSLVMTMSRLIYTFNYLEDACHTDREICTK